jgi:hypothetical protein
VAIVDDIMSKALADAPLATVNIVVPCEQRFIVTGPAPVKTLDQPVYVVGSMIAPCYDVLHELTPDLPLTYQHFRFYTVPKNWEELMRLERIPLIDYALDHTDEVTAVFLLSAMMARIAHGDATSATIYVRNLCASRLAMIEAEYVCQRIDCKAAGLPVGTRQRTAFDYMAVFWPVVAIGHLQLAGTEYHSSMREDFRMAQRAVERAIKAFNNQ